MFLGGAAGPERKNVLVCGDRHTHMWLPRPAGQQVGAHTEGEVGSSRQHRAGTYL